MSGHGHMPDGNKLAAIVISILAALLAVSETLGKSAQTDGLTAQIEASNLWGFFQAKTVRQTTLRTAVDGVATILLPGLPDDARSRAEQRVAEWRATIERWETEPATDEGRRELSARAKAMESRRDRSLAAYHMLEMGSAAFQLAIVLTSASVVVSVGLLLWIGAGIGGVGLVLTALGSFAPNLFHL
jgi:type IV secretory pathway TrbD component